MPSGAAVRPEFSVAAAHQVVPEALPELLLHEWPELGRPKAEASGPGRQTARAWLDASLKAGEAEVEVARKAAARVVDNALASLLPAELAALAYAVEDEEDDEEGEDGEEVAAGSSGRRRRRRRRHRRSSGSQGAVNAESYLSSGIPTSEDEVAGPPPVPQESRPRNVVTWDDLLGADQKLKPTSPSGGFTRACGAAQPQPQQLRRQEFAGVQLRQHQQQPMLLQTRPPPQQRQFWEQQKGQLFPQQQQAYWDNSAAVKALPFMPVGLGNGMQWVVTEVPSEWTPTHADELHHWMCRSVTNGSVPLLSDLDSVLQGLASHTYED